MRFESYVNAALAKSISTNTKTVTRPIASIVPPKKNNADKANQAASKAPMPREAGIFHYFTTIDCNAKFSLNKKETAIFHSRGLSTEVQKTQK